MRPEGDTTRELLGEILVARGHCTLSQVDEARRWQQLFEPKATPFIGKILCQLGYSTEYQIEEALREQQNP